MHIAAVSASTAAGSSIVGRVPVTGKSSAPWLGRRRSADSAGRRRRLTGSPPACRDASKPETLDNRLQSDRADTPYGWSPALCNPSRLPLRRAVLNQHVRSRHALWRHADGCEERP